LVNYYYIKYKEYTNDEEKLFNFWQNLTEEEKNKQNVIFDGEHRLNGELTNFFSEDSVVNRIAAIFKQTCGYLCDHPRPLHDYWDKLIPYNEKWTKGIFKYDTDTLYKILHEKYMKRKEESKIKEIAEKEKKGKR
jgi:hypothetical protein